MNSLINFVEMSSDGSEMVCGVIGPQGRIPAQRQLWSTPHRNQKSIFERYNGDLIGLIFVEYAEIDLI